MCELPTYGQGAMTQEMAAHKRCIGMQLACKSCKSDRKRPMHGATQSAVKGMGSLRGINTAAARHGPARIITVTKLAHETTNFNRYLSYPIALEHNRSCKTDSVLRQDVRVHYDRQLSETQPIRTDDKLHSTTYYRVLHNSQSAGNT